MGCLHSPFGLLPTPHGAQIRIPVEYLCRQISAYVGSRSHHQVPMDVGFISESFHVRFLPAKNVARHQLFCTPVTNDQFRTNLVKGIRLF